MAALVCPQCGHKNLPGAPYCEKCWTTLSGTPSVPRRTTLTLSAVSTDVDAATANRRRVKRTAHVGMLGARSIALYVDSQSEPLIVMLLGQVILGRAVLLAAPSLVDLSPYGAGDKGVSRQHCSLNRGSTGIMVQDMGSSNGTWLEEVRLEPYQSVPITSGALLRLGQLELEIYLPE